MPIPLGGPEIVVGDVTSGKLVIRDLQYVPTTQLPTEVSGSGPVPISLDNIVAPINPNINLNTPAIADERLVLLDRGTNSYITASPSVGKEAIASNPMIQFVAAFDSATADKVAETLAADPPGNIQETILDANGKNDIVSNMQALAFLNAVLVSLGNRGSILSELLSTGKLSPSIDIYQMYDLAKQINDFENIYDSSFSESVVVDDSQHPGVTTLALGEESPAPMQAQDELDAYYKNAMAITGLPYGQLLGGMRPPNYGVR